MNQEEAFSETLTEIADHIDGFNDDLPLIKNDLIRDFTSGESLRKVLKIIEKKANLASYKWEEFDAWYKAFGDEYCDDEEDLAEYYEDKESTLAEEIIHILHRRARLRFRIDQIKNLQGSLNENVLITTNDEQRTEDLLKENGLDLVMNKSDPRFEITSFPIEPDFNPSVFSVK